MLGDDGDQEVGVVNVVVVVRNMYQHSPSSFSEKVDRLFSGICDSVGELFFKLLRGIP